MQLDTLISPDEATERLAAYEAQIAEERTVEDDAVRAGLRAAKRGLPVISLSAVMAAGGTFPDGLPRLAVARANATTVYVQARFPTAERCTYVFHEEPWDRGRAVVGRNRVEVTVPAPVVPARRRTWHASTIVPTVPPNVRPSKRRLRLFHVLWEVERWDPTPPVDPALLRHIRGDLWAVQATWDLTPLERAVLAGRAA